VLEPAYGKQAAAALDGIEGDPSRSKLWESIRDAIDLVCDHPTSARARAVALRVDEVTFWQVRIPAPGEDQPWRLIWRPVGDSAVIAYIGT
jgi:hypothetical protein